MTRLTIVGIVGVLAAASISVAASWSQPREVRLPTGQRDGRLILVASCTSAELAQCKGQASQRCGNNSNCVAEGVAQCEITCTLENESKPVPRPVPNNPR